LSEKLWIPACAGMTYFVNWDTCVLRYIKMPAFFFCVAVSVLCLAVSVTAAENPFSEDRVVMDYLWHSASLLPASKRPKIALVLSGGGARGFAHIGVLRVLKRHGLPVDIVVGVSIGAVIGSLYAGGVPLERLEYISSDLGWDKIADMGSASLVGLLLGSNLLSTERLEAYLEKYLGGKRFHELDIKFACVAVDISTGERIVFSEGKVASAVRASATIPGIFEPVMFRHRYLVDGGLIDNIPVDIARSMGADIVIVLTARSDYTLNPSEGIFRTLTQAIYIQGALLENESLKKADFIISPDVKGVSAIDLSKAKECIAAGVVETESRMDALKEFIVRRVLERAGADVYK